MSALKKSIKPKAKPDVSVLFVQIESALYSRLKKHVDRKAGYTWRALVEAMIARFLKEEDGK